MREPTKKHKGFHFIIYMGSENRETLERELAPVAEEINYLNDGGDVEFQGPDGEKRKAMVRSEEHTSELQSLMRISYAVFCLKKKKKNNYQKTQDRIQPI